MTRFILTLIAFCLTIVMTEAQNRRPGPPPIISPEVTESSVRFRLHAPQAKEVTLRGQWSRDPSPMTRDESGVWSAVVKPPPVGVWEYSFSVDGFNSIDPQNPAIKPQRAPQRSVLHIPATPPAPWDLQEVPHGTVHHHTYASKALSRPRDLSVYTPPGYESAGDAKYPLLVLQHGMGDNQRTWVEHGKAHWILDDLIAEGKARPMIVVMLEGHPLGVGAFLDEETRAKTADAFRRDLMEEALPLVESNYRVAPEATQRAIAGLSMGGGQALQVGLSHPDRFAWVGAFSAAAPRTSDAAKLLATPEVLNGLRLLWIAIGKEDFLLQLNEGFIASLKEKNIRHEYELTEGGHSWPVWRQYLAQFLPRLFAAESQ